MTTATASAPKTSGRVEANGVDYYYEIHGQGEPLLLLHGGLGSIDMFAPVLPILAEHREVVAVDLHGHGRTTLGARKLDLVDMGDDLAAILDRLGYEQLDAMGYSLGGGVAFRLAVQHPEKVRRLVIASASYSTDGLHPEMRPQQGALTGAMADAMKGTPMYESYMAVAPQPEDFPKLLDRIGESMSQTFDWSDDIAKLTMPVMLVYGDSDMFRPDHIVDFYKRLGGGLRDAGWQREHQSPNRLAILPDLTHYDIFLDPDFARTALRFLDGERTSHSWGEQANSELTLRATEAADMSEPAYDPIVDDADAAYQRALAAGATSVTRVTELFWGDRVGRVRDRLGNIWWLQSRAADVPEQELQARLEDPAMLEAMRYVQQSLLDALRK